MDGIQRGLADKRICLDDGQEEPRKAGVRFQVSGLGKNRGPTCETGLPESGTV